MANDSATGGYLSPVGEPPPQDREFDRQLQAVVVGITGLPGPMVRPRWQPTPPPQPAADVDWAAIGITEVGADTFPVVIHDGAGQGRDLLQRHETVDLLVSFYGPHGLGNAALLRDGLAIAQNREAMFLANMGLRAVDRKIVTAPALVNEQWVRRFDLAFTIRRRIDRAYSVLNLLQAQGAVRSRTASVTFDTSRE